MTPGSVGDYLHKAGYGRDSPWTLLSGFTRAARHVADIEELLGLSLALCIDLFPGTRAAIVETGGMAPRIRATRPWAEPSGTGVPDSVWVEIAAMASDVEGAVLIDGARASVRGGLALPLWEAEHVLGVLCIAADESFLPDPESLSVVEVLGDRIASTLLRERGVEPKPAPRHRPLPVDPGNEPKSEAPDLNERPRADADLRFLLDAGIKLCASLDLGETVHRVARSAVPYLGDLAVVDLQEHDTIRRVAVAHADDSREGLAQRLALLPETGALRSPIARAIRMRTPAWGELQDGDLESLNSDPEHGQVLRELKIRGFLVVPLMVRDQVLGALTVYSSGRNRRFEARDVFTALELGRRAGLAVENAQLHAAAMQAVSLREELVNVASHDLKTPLSAIHLRATMLERRLGGTGSPEVLDGLRGIIRTTRQMETLILDLLESATVTGGKLDLAVRDEDLVRLSTEAVDSVRPLALDSGLQLEIALPSSPVVSRCDRGRILQVLSNILGNALKFTPQGGRIGLSLESVGGRAVFRISDTGRGIAPEDLPVIFERYRRARNSSGSAGHGLGLFIVKGILDAHGGQIRAESQLGVGSTFTFNLPSFQVG